MKMMQEGCTIILFRMGWEVNIMHTTVRENICLRRINGSNEELPYLECASIKHGNDGRTSCICMATHYAVFAWSNMMVSIYQVTVVSQNPYIGGARLQHFQMQMLRK